MAKMTNIFDLFEVSPEEDKMKKEIEGANSVSINKLKPFSNHPFKLYQGDRLKDMIESIKEHGIITPVIVRPIDDGYEILSGHNRVNAAKLAEIENVPVVIKENLTDEEAMLIVTETNLIQRSFNDLSHSERARVLTEHYKAIKEQGKKNDLIDEIEKLSNTDEINEKSDLGQFGPKIFSREKVANSYDLSPRAVSRYLKVMVVYILTL